LISNRRSLSFFMKETRKQIWLALLLMLAATAIFYWRIWTPNPADRMYFEGDIYDKDYPQRVAWMRIVSEQGRFPFWNPYEFGGWPALANCEMGVLYPPQWLLFLGLGEDGRLTYFALELLVLGHFVLAGWLMVLLLQRYGLSFGPAVFGALIYAFCGFHGGHKLHVNMFFTIVWFPLILYFVEGALQQKKPRLFLAAALALAVSCLAGHPQMFYFILLLVAVRLVWESVAEVKAGGQFPAGILQLVCRLLMVFAPAIMIAAVQVFPSLELFEYTARAGGGSYGFASEFSLPPVQLAEFLLPGTFPWFFVEVFYAGVWAWPLAWVALRWSHRLKETPAWTFWLAVLAGGLVMAVGDYAGVFPAGYLLVPGLSRIRAPSRWLYFVDMALAVLAAGGFEAVLRASSAPKENWGNLSKRLRRVVRWLVVLFLIGIFYLHVEGMKPYPQVHLQNLKRMAGDLTFVVILYGLGWMLLVLFEGKRIHRWGLIVGFCLVVFFDLMTYNSQINVVAELPGYEPAAAVHRLKPDKKAPFRYWAPPEERRRVNGNIHGLEEAGGHSPLAPVEYLETLQAAIEGHVSVFQQEGIRYVYQGVPSALRGIVEHTGGGLWRVPEAFPRVYAVEDAVPVDSNKIRGKLVNSKAWNHQQLAWVESVPKEVSGSSEHGGFPLPLLLRGTYHGIEDCFIVLDGKEIRLQNAGYHLIVINHAGKVEKKANFGLLQDSAADGKMADFLQSIPGGRWVAGVYGGDVRPSLSDRLKREFGQLGLDPFDHPGSVRSHAFLAKKGDGGRKAIEKLSWAEAIVAVGAVRGKTYAMRPEDSPERPEPEEILEYGAGYYRIAAPSIDKAIFIVSEKNYPGWRAGMNTDSLPVVGAGCHAVAIFFQAENPGEITLSFRPAGWGRYIGVSAAGFLLVFSGLFLLWPQGLNKKSGCWFSEKNQQRTGEKKQEINP
jgi:hypothetical protein